MVGRDCIQLRRRRARARGIRWERAALEDPADAHGRAHHSENLRAARRGAPPVFTTTRGGWVTMCPVARTSGAVQPTDQRWGGA